MTTHVVADDILGTITRRRWEVERRLMEGTIDPNLVARNLQLTAEAEEISLASQIIMASPFFANEQVPSNYGYPQGYVLKPVCEQLVALSRHFPGLDTSSVLACSKELPPRPQGAEGWFAVPKFDAVAATYNEAVEMVIALLGKTRTLYNYVNGKLGPKYLRLSERTAFALQVLGAQQKGDFLLIPAQFGLNWAGRSVRKVRYNYAPNEFGLGSFITCCMILSHPERFVQWEQLHVDMAGDEYSPGADGQFDRAPCLLFRGGRLGFGTRSVDFPDEHYGTASGFLQQ